MSTNPTTTAALPPESVRKFLFDRSFDENAPVIKKDHAKPVTFTVEQVEVEKKLAYDSGYQDGQKAREDSQAAKMNSLLAQIDMKISSLVNANDAFQQELLKHAREISLAIVRKIMPTYITQNGLSEIESIITQVISERSKEPRLVVRVGESQFEELSGKINALAEQNAYAGKIIVLCEDNLGPSDCLIEWADGGVDRNVAEIWQSIEKIMGTKGSPDPQIPTDGETT